MRIAYLNFGEQSGVTRGVTEQLVSRGHRVEPFTACGPLELRDRASGARRLTPRVLAHLAASLARFGPRLAVAHRWNTPYAFDVHSAHVAAQLATRECDVVLQNGALFKPPGPAPYVLYCDYTSALAMRAAAYRDAVLRRSPDFGSGWKRREIATYRGAARIATFSMNTKRSLVEDYGIDDRNVVVVGAGANVFPDRVSRQHDGRTIVFIGKAFEVKGGAILLKAFELLRRSRPDARLLIAGPPRELTLPAGATHLGFVPFAELPDLLSKATVFTMPPLREPFGIAYLDAMACGVACVGTRVDAVPEIVEHGRTGLIVPPGDVRALADALAAMLADPDAADAMGAAGRAKVAAQYLWSGVAERLEQCLVDAAPRPSQLAA